MNRLDKELVSRNLAPSRAQAGFAIDGGYVTVNGQVVRKSSYKVTPDDEIILNDPNARYVSRGAQKLLSIAHDVDGKVALDLGASTGGFTQVLLELGAKHIFAVDVGHGQLHPSLAENARVISVEGFNVKSLDASAIDHELWPNFEVISCDLSFISLTKALPAALDLAKAETRLFALVKPQFELEPKDIGKGGIVKSDILRAHALLNVIIFLENAGWILVRHIPSPITGSDGNHEFMLEAIKA